MTDPHAPHHIDDAKESNTGKRHAQICTKEEWGRIILIAATVKAVERLDERHCVLTVVAGDSEKDVLAEGNLPGIEGVIGGKVIVLDNVEPTKAAGKTFNGKVLTIPSAEKDLLIRADAKAISGARVQ